MTQFSVKHNANTVRASEELAWLLDTVGLCDCATEKVPNSISLKGSGLALEVAAGVSGEGEDISRSDKSCKSW